MKRFILLVAVFILFSCTRYSVNFGVTDDGIATYRTQGKPSTLDSALIRNIKGQWDENQRIKRFCDSIRAASFASTNGSSTDRLVRGIIVNTSGHEVVVRGATERDIRLCPQQSSGEVFLPVGKEVAFVIDHFCGSRLQRTETVKWTPNGMRNEVFIFGRPYDWIFWVK